jgi:hypothetical protein
MFHTFRHTMRLITLAIGFLLFVLVAVHSAQSARDRQAVVGKPMLWLAQHAASGTASALGLNDSDEAEVQTVALHSPSPTDLSDAQQVEPSSTEDDQTSVASDDAQQAQEDADAGDSDQQDEQTTESHSSSRHTVVHIEKHDE